MKIVVASKNPVKIEAARAGFERMFQDVEIVCEGISVPSGVSDQPMHDTEIYAGAHNRAENASVAVPDADYWVGLEGGVEEHGEGDMLSFAWIVVRGKDGRYGKGRTGTLFLPSKVAELIRSGMELGDADDVVFGRSNSKQVNGAVGLLTHDVVTRAQFYSEAVVFALIPFVNEGLY